jgi:hypothetical protein
VAPRVGGGDPRHLTVGPLGCEVWGCGLRLGRNGEGNNAKIAFFRSPIITGGPRAPATIVLLRHATLLASNAETHPRKAAQSPPRLHG